MYPNTQKQFFEGSIHLVFAVVVAQGFTIAGKIFLPITNVYSYDGVLHALSLIFVYFFTLTAWYGFFKSVKLFPHNNISRFTITRYGIAIFNTFILYYIITLTASASIVDYQTIFLLVIIYFGMIIAVHLIKSVETEGIKIGIHYRLQKTVFVTAVFLGLSVFSLVMFEYLLKEAPNLKWDEHVAWNPIFILIFFGLSAWYRWLMWKEKWKMPRRGTTVTG